VATVATTTTAAPTTTAVSTTATLAAASTASTASTTTAAAGTTILGGADGERTAVAIRGIERLDGSLALFGGAHGDEAEATAATGLTVGDDFGPLHGAVCAKHLLKPRVVDRPGQVAYVEFQNKPR